MSDTIEYVCENPACSLGAIGQLGRFTAGMTAEQKHLLTGKPFDALEEGADYGDGICPNCGTAGAAYDKKAATQAALADAKAAYDAQVATLKEGVN